MKLFQSKAYKVIIGFVYGWGATAVIIGALFKIMHFPGAGIVLTVGMLVEAFIFFMSAFEPALEHYDWSRVFPVLGKSEAEWERRDARLRPCLWVSCRAQFRSRRLLLLSAAIWAVWVPRTLAN